MKNVKTVISQPIRVKKNVTVQQRADWMQIKDVATGEILHTGRPAYIKRIAVKRYGQKVVS